MKLIQGKSYVNTSLNCVEYEKHTPANQTFWSMRRENPLITWLLPLQKEIAFLKI